MKILIGLLFGCILFSQTANSQVQKSVVDNSEPIIDNGILTLKIDLTRGGAISYLSLSGSNRSIVNIADEGRYIQQSYYAGQPVDRKSEGQSPNWSPWSWNPIQVGDAYRNRAKILEFQNNGTTLHVKCTPMLWDMNNKPAEADMEQWTTLTGNVITVRNRLTCHRTDDIYLEGILDDQELPAVYPVSALKNLYSYFGDSPFTNGSLSNPATVNLASGFWGRYINNMVTENWMAYVDDTKWGIGVYNPACSDFIAGMSGQPGGEATSGSTSYIAPVRKEILNRNSVYEYEYYLIVGTIDEIRSKIYGLHASNPLITSIMVRSEREVSTLNGPGNTMQMLATVFPAVAKNLVNWSVDFPDVATIDSHGVLTAVKPGVVTVKATATDGTGVAGSKIMTITNIPQKNSWEFSASPEGWITAHSGIVSVTDGTLAFNITGNDPYVVGPVFTDGWRVGSLKYLWIRIKNKTTDNAGALYIFPDAVSGGGFTAVTIPLTPTDTEFRDVFVDMTLNPKWIPACKVTNFRLDPANSAVTGMVNVDFIRFIESRPPLVSAINILSEGDATEIKGIGSTLQLYSKIIPAQADSTVKWSVDNEAIAVIDQKGLLTAVSNGTVNAKATARDGSGVYGTKSVKITILTPIRNIQLANLHIYPNPATNQLIVICEQQEARGITISDLQGRTVYSKNESFIGSKSFDLSLKKGIYLITIKGLPQFPTQKLIID